MLTIRNRHYGSPARELLPWGDPYILQLFEPDGVEFSGGRKNRNQSRPGWISKRRHFQMPFRKFVGTLIKSRWLGPRLGKPPDRNQHGARLGSTPGLVI